MSRGSFVVLKVIIDQQVHLLLRRNNKWQDVNLIGGHAEMRDKGSLLKTAQRELWEEVPSIRGIRDVILEPLTDEVIYGPTYSRSAGVETRYLLQFFAVRLSSDPRELVNGLGVRSRNIFVPEVSVLEQQGVRTSGLIRHLDKLLPRGIASVPLSSAIDMHKPAWWTSGGQEQLQLGIA